jgi:hypothetical protein
MNLSKVLLTLAVVATAAAGCSGGGSPVGGAAATPTAVESASFEALSMSVGRQFSQCARQNGLANFPDPIVANGALSWPNTPKEDIERAEQSCRTVLQQLASIPQVVDPPSAETLGHMRQFAQCMRTNGVSDWPDPKADGTFPLLGTRFRHMARYSQEQPPQDVLDARMACLEYEVEWRIAAS